MAFVRAWTVALGIALGALVAPSAQAQTVLNAGFEQGTGASNFTSWGGSSSFTSTSSDFAPRSGSRTANVPCINNMQSGCFLTQTINGLQNGSTYKFSFYAISPGAGGHAQMQFNGVTVFDQAFQSTSYKLYSVNVVAGGYVAGDRDWRLCSS